LFVTQNPGRLSGDPAQGFPSVREALLQANPGDRIVVLDEVLREVIRLEESLRVVGVTLESGLPEGRRVAWLPPKDLEPNQPLLHLAHAADFRLKGFTLDGEHRLGELMMITGQCPGLRLENLELVHFRRRAITLVNCTGASDARVTLGSVRILTDWETPKTAVAFEARPVEGLAPVNQHLLIQDCRFEGLFGAVLLLDGSVLDLEFRRNRIFATKDQDAPWVTDAVRYKRAQPPHAIRLTMASNTVSRLASGIHFEILPPADGVNRVVLQNNLIVGAHAFVAIDGPVTETRARPLFPDYGGNVTRPGYSPKQPSWLPLTRVEFPYLVVNQTNDGNFLRYKKDSPLAQAGVNGEPVGVPPVED
jgi:hypothetical protein